MVKVVISEFALISTAEASLQRKCVRNAKLFPDGDAGSRLLCLLDRKRTISEIENVAIFVHQTWENPLLQPVVNSATVSVHENILLATVTVQIAN
jgi:hypothetical protein